MRRNLTLLSLLVLSLSQALAQNVGKLFFLDDNNRLATLDPNTASSSAISANAVLNGGLLPGAVTIDNEGNRFFFATTDGAAGAELVTVDLNTGDPLSTISLNIAPAFLEYHCQNGLLYTIDQANNLVSIDPASGELDIIAPLVPQSIDFTTATLDPYNNRLFFVSFEPLTLRLYAVSTETGAALTSFDIGDDISFLNMEYNCREGL
ncbi:MAG: hypothetical protein KDD10_04155, partial [Phaeodactylibacter sp.]|nr:hypothetical protein [Phaeodactylibacter sp.]